MYIDEEDRPLGTGDYLLVPGVPAYPISIYAPASLTVGLPRIVNSTTTFGIGSPIMCTVPGGDDTGTASGQGLRVCPRDGGALH